MTLTLQHRLRTTLREVAATRGVFGALLADAADGIIIASTLDVGLDAEAVAALAASLYTRANAASDGAGHGSAVVLHIHAEHGWVCVTGHGALVLVVVADRRAAAGPVRAAMLRARTALADL